MLKKKITFTDFNGVERTEDFYFNLSKAELIRLNYTSKGGFQGMLEQMMATQDTPAMYEYFEKIIRDAYGTKSADGRQFSKSPEITASFVESNAFGELMMELFTDETNAIEFIRGIFSGLDQQAFDKQIAEFKETGEFA